MYYLDNIIIIYAASASIRLVKSTMKVSAFELSAYCIDNSNNMTMAIIFFYITFYVLKESKTNSDKAIPN